jgi:hypothetical protein
MFNFNLAFLDTCGNALSVRCRSTEQLHCTHIGCKWHLWPPQHLEMAQHFLEQSAEGIGSEAGTREALVAMPELPPAKRACTGCRDKATKALDCSFRHFDDQTRVVLDTAATMSSAVLRRFMEGNLPGSSQTFSPSPYLDCQLFHAMQSGARFHPFAQSMRQPSPVAMPPVAFHCHNSNKSAFVLDCSCLSADVAPLMEQGMGVSVVHSFHPHLPLVVSCCGALGSLVVHHRSGCA